MKQEMISRFLLIFLFVSFFSFPVCAADKDSPGSVMQSFTQNAFDLPTAVKADDVGKHKILFIMGVILLVLIFITAGLGMAMAFNGKDVFVPHMISAGATVFLAVAHAVTSIVWFFPY